MKKMLMSLLAPIFLLFVGVSFSDFKAKMVPANFHIDSGEPTDCYEIHYHDSCISVPSSPNADKTGCPGGCDDNTYITVSDNKKLNLYFYSDGKYIGNPVSSKLKIKKLGNGTKVAEYYKNNNQGLQYWMWDSEGNIYFDGTKRTSSSIPLHPLNQ